MSSIAVYERTSLGALRDVPYDYIARVYPSGGRYAKAIDGDVLCVAYPTPSGNVNTRHSISNLPDPSASASIRNALIVFDDGLDAEQQRLKAIVLAGLISFDLSRTLTQWQLVATNYDAFIRGLRVFPASSRTMLFVGSFLGAGAFLGAAWYFLKGRKR